MFSKDFLDLNQISFSSTVNIGVFNHYLISKKIFLYKVFSCEGRSILSGLKDFAPYRKTDIKKKKIKWYIIEAICH